jgi:hypothetical protein
MSLKDLKVLVNNGKHANSELDELKERLKKFYANLRA